MWVILFAVLAVLVQNGDSSCMSEMQSSVQGCQKILDDAGREASAMSDSNAQGEKLCCALSRYETCLADAGKKCGDSVEQFLKQTLEMAKSSIKASCGDYSCSSGNSIVPVNTVVVYLLLYLGYYLYANKF